MSELFNVYCDESCHLENDRHDIMVLGGVWCSDSKKDEITQRLREIKREHHFDPKFEVKWSKVSDGASDFYLDFLDYFFDDDDLHFRSVFVPDKDVLDHDNHNQTHNDFYYKLYFLLLNNILDPEHVYRIYLDIKDTRGGEKISKLKEVLSNAKYDFSQSIIEHIQLMHSHEIELMQLADLLIGAVSYVNRGCEGNEGKEKIIGRIKQRTGYSLTKSTFLKERKFNLFRWTPRDPLI